MMIDYSLLTEKTRTCLSSAQQMTNSCKYSQVEPQILMIAIIKECKEMVFFLLQNMSVNRITFCQDVGDSLNGVPHSDIGERRLSKDTEKIIQNTFSLVQQAGLRFVPPEFLFSSFFYVDNPIRNIMQSNGITKDKIDASVQSFRAGSQQQQIQNRATNSSFFFLNKYARNLSALAEEGKIDPVIGREAETRRILEIISRKTKNNPMLVGAPGTGKTAIIEGLANRIARGDIPQDLRGIKIYSLDIPSVMAGAGARGEFEERIKGIVNDAKTDSSIVLFIDEIHLLIGAGGGNMDAANILKPELARGELKVIGATTVEECTKYIETDKAFERRFQKVLVDEPDVDSAITILRGIKSRFENYHHIKISDGAIVSAVKLSDRYITDRHLPDKAIDLIDEAASKMRIERSSVPVELDKLSRTIRSKEMERESLRQDEETHNLTALDSEISNLKEKENELNAKWQNERARFEEIQSKRDEIEQLRINCEQAELSNRFDEAVTLKNQLEKVNREMNALLEEISNDSSTLLKNSLDENDIRATVTLWTGIPIENINDDENEKLLHLEEILQGSVIGQNQAVSAVSKVIRRNRMGFADANKPIGSFLFLGTTGVGKTELAKTLAQYLFNSREMIVRIDMSEYQQEHSVSRLFGAPPGYVGYDQGGQLTEAIRHKPYSVVLLDEIEKAHPKIFESLLQVLDDGRMTDGQGRVVDFKNTIIIMTSNIGASAISDIFFNTIDTSESIRRAENLSLSMLKERLAPEFINRIDDIVLFSPLGLPEIRKISELQLKQLCNNVSQNGLDLNFDEKAVDLLTSIGFEPEYGARPIKRAISDRIINALTMELLSKSLDKQKPILVSANDVSFIFRNN